MTAPKILKVTRDIMIAELAENLMDNVIQQVKKEDYSWILEVISTGFIGYNDMVDEVLVADYWECFGHELLIDGFDDLEMEK